jgi:hypothetical protein
MSAHEHVVWQHQIVSEPHDSGWVYETGECSAYGADCGERVHRWWHGSQHDLGDDGPWNRWRLLSESVDDQRQGAVS